MKGKVCVITGATSGIGRAAALGLGSLGASVVLIGRNEPAGENVAGRVRSSGGEATFLRADLAAQAEVHVVAGQIAQRHPPVDVLINNAGARFDQYQRSHEGFELTFANNHLGHFLLTCLLSDSFLAAPAARIITVSSRTHAAAVAADGWQLRPDAYDRHQAYARSKLANVLFAYELAARLHGTRTTSNAVDPGIVATRFGRNNGFLRWAKHLAYHGVRGELTSARHAAGTVVYLASSSEVKSCTGKYFFEKREIQSSAASYDRPLAQQLWNSSLQWVGLSADATPAWAQPRLACMCA